MKRLWKWFAVIGGGAAAVLGAILAVVLRRRKQAMTDGDRTEIKKALDDGLKSIEGRIEAEREGQKRAAGEEVREAADSLEEKANAVDPDDSPWFRSRRDH